MAGGTFPTSVPSYTITSGAETLNAASGGLGISGLLNNMETDITALAAKVGTGSSTSTNNTFLIGDGTGTSSWSSLTSAQLASRITNETGSGSLVFGTSPTLSAPVISTISNTGTLTLPTSTDTLVGRATTDTLTNKTLTTPTIASFANANHDHSNSAGGGTLTSSALGAGSVTYTKLGTDSSYAWASFTPTWANLTIGNAVVTAAYKQHGKLVVGFIKVVLGNTSSVSSNPTFTAPVTAAAVYGTGSNNLIGTGYVEDAGVASSNCALAFNASTAAISLLTQKTDGTYGALVGFTSTIPISWGSTDFFNATFTYEAA